MLPGGGDSRSDLILELSFKCQVIFNVVNCIYNKTYTCTRKRVSVRIL